MDRTFLFEGKCWEFEPLKEYLDFLFHNVNELQWDKLDFMFLDHSGL